MRTATIVTAVLMAATSVLGAGTPVKRDGATPLQTPSAVPSLGGSTSVGCYSSGGNMTKYPNLPFNSHGGCVSYCLHNFTEAYFVAATQATDCYCGDWYPAKNSLVDDSHCTFPCPGYTQEACGGINNGEFWSVFNTGEQVVVPYVDSSTSGGSGSSPTNPTESSASASHSASGGGSSAGAVVGGVVVAVVAVIAIIGGVFFYLRRRRNREMEDEHHRNAAVSAFINGGKPPGSSGGLSMTDSRMDPVMANRRLSSGSIADNQDYSRKILRVTNA